MKKPIVIALTGKARAGKDTVANIMFQLLTSYNDQQVDHDKTYILGVEAFAAPIKSMVAMLLDFFGFGKIMEPATLQPYIDGDKKEIALEGIGCSPRRLMQTLGTEWGRDIIKDSLWVDCMSQRINMYADGIENFGYGGAVVIVTDCRFDNEANQLRDLHDAFVVRVLRPEGPEIEGAHHSEAGVHDDLVDCDIVNDGDENDLVKAVKDWLDANLPFEVPPLEETVDE